MILMSPSDLDNQSLNWGRGTVASGPSIRGQAHLCARFERAQRSRWLALAQIEVRRSFWDQHSGSVASQRDSQRATLALQHPSKLGTSGHERELRGRGDALR